LLVSKAVRLVYHSTQGSRVMKEEEKEPLAEGPGSSLARLVPVAFEGVNTGSMPPACVAVQDLGISYGNTCNS